MKPATLKAIKDELQHQNHDEIKALVLRLARFKKENKELLSYLLFDSMDEASFIQSLKDELASDFRQINTASPFYIKKSLRKILRKIRKYSRLSSHKETEIELLLYFNQYLKEKTSFLQYPNLLKIYQQQLISIKNKLPKLHEDLQYDFKMMLEQLSSDHQK